MSIVRAKLQAKLDAEFISISEILTLLENVDGCTLSEAAQYLYDLVAQSDKLRRLDFLVCSELHGIELADDASFLATISGMTTGYDTAPWGADCEFYGFERMKLLELLDEEGIVLPTKMVTEKCAPTWAAEFRAIKRIGLFDAACILTGADPMEYGQLDFGWQREIERTKTALSQAADDCDMIPCGIDSGKQPIFCTEDLREWARANDYTWPIPEIQPSAGPAPALSGSALVASDEVLKRLQESERTRNELLAEVERLKAEVEQALATKSKILPSAWDGNMDDLPPLTEEKVEEGARWVAAMQQAEALEMEAERERRLKNWWGASSSFIVSVMRANQCTSAKELFRKLEETAGESSPFELGTGANRGALVWRERVQKISLKSVQNHWPKIKEAALQGM